MKMYFRKGMQIEIIEFYPIKFCEEKRILTGTIRIRLPEIGIHILGVFVNKNKDHWFFALPGRKGIDHQTGEMVRYPYITFENENQQKELIAAIRIQAPIFIEKRLVDAEKPLVLPQKQKIEDNKMQASKKKDNAMKTKQTEKEVGRIVPSIAHKIWQDPPPRKNTRKTCIYGKYG